MNKTNICLNMIVKNETPVLERLINSVKDIIDYYVIVDTGSTDGTPEFIKTQMAHYQIPGEVLCREWVNFAVNRNQALEAACARRNHGWLLLIDADDELSVTEVDFYRHLTPGTTYCLRKHSVSMRYSLTNLIDISQTRWRWQGVVHEYLEQLDGNNTRVTLEQVWIETHPGEGVRSRGFSDEQKYLSDAKLLEIELAQNPNDHRSQFYLAQSYRDAGHLEAAYLHYLKRANMGGWAEESFYAQLQAAQIAAQLNKPSAIVMEAYLQAYELRPSRAEALHGIAVYCRIQRQFNLAYLFLQQALQLPYPDDLLFVNPEVYQWRLLEEMGISGYWAGHYQAAKDAGEKILHLQATGVITLSEADLTRIRENLNFAISKLTT